MNIIIREPATAREWQQYYELRWKILRAPWQQPQGSEKDELEEQAFHRAAFDEQKIVGVSRLHQTDNGVAQIRYMAVDPLHQGCGIGKQLLATLEDIARSEQVHQIELNARENAIGFYQAAGYENLRPTHTLYQCIPHVLMQKRLG